MKALSFIAATIALCSFCGDAMAQKATASTASQSRSRASNVTIIEGAALAGPAGAVGAAAASSSGLGFNQPQLVMNSTNTSAPGTFNDCGVSDAFAIWLISWSGASEAKRCVLQRLAQLHLTMGEPTMARELLCGIDYVSAADKSSGRNACPDQRAAETKRLAGQPVSQPVAIQPVQQAPVGREVCLNAAGREVPAGTPGASCGFVGS